MHQRFSKDFESIIEALFNKQFKKTASEQLTITDYKIKSFEELKNRSTSSYVLTLLRPDKSYVLDTGANAGQLGCVLLKEQDDESFKPVRYFCRALKDAERNYDTTERECHAIIRAVLMLRSSLDGAHFTLPTDHDALKSFFGPASTSGKL